MPYRVFCLNLGCLALVPEGHRLDSLGDLGLSEGSRLEEAQPFGEPPRWGCGGRPSGGMELAAGVFEEGTEPEGPGVVESEVGGTGLCRLRFQPVLLGGLLGLGPFGGAPVAVPGCHPLSAAGESVKMRFFPRAHLTPWASLSGEKSVQGPGGHCRDAGGCTFSSWQCGQLGCRHYDRHLCPFILVAEKTGNGLTDWAPWPLVSILLGEREGGGRGAAREAVVLSACVSCAWPSTRPSLAGARGFCFLPCGG